MAAIDFPNSPTTGQLFTVGQITWKWSGTVWQGQGTAIVGPAGADGAQGADGEPGAPRLDGEANFNSFMLMGA
jgi:hypothetical protein